MAIHQAHEETAMSTAIAVFVKTPSLSPVKTRLAATLGDKKALIFYTLSLEAIEDILKNAAAYPYWAVAEEDGVNDPRWHAFPALYTGAGNLGQRQHRIYETLLKDHEQVLLIGADAPQISNDIIKQAIGNLKNNDFVIGPARDGGYYLFGGRQSTPQDMWCNGSWSTEYTRAQLENAMPSKPYPLRTLTDVDTQTDLRILCAEMPEHITPAQSKLRQWINALA